MINLFDKYDAKSSDLKNSLDAAGIKNTTVILNDDGFLFDGATSPIAFFTGMYDVQEKTPPKFFNEVPTPNYWEIRGSSQGGEIFEGYKKRAEIVYSDRGEDYRIIKEVKWFNDLDRIRQVDYYNKYGNLFAKKTFSDGEVTLTTFLNLEKQEVILMNHITKSIQVTYEDKNYIFDSYIDFVIFYFKCAEFNLNSIYYNSLADPFFIVDALEKFQDSNSTSHVLFWQEESQEMPGNMRSIIDSDSSITKKIVVQDRDEFVRLQNQTDNQNILNYLGFIYQYNENTDMSKSAYILTNSDNVEHLQEIVNGLPDWKIYVAALTEMSDKLMSFEGYNNVILEPSTTIEDVHKRCEECSFYLDINHNNEVLNIVRREFDSNKLIFAFDNTIHNRLFINEDNVINHESPELLIQKLEAASRDYATYKQELTKQRDSIGQETVAEYRRILI